MEAGQAELRDEVAEAALSHVSEGSMPEVVPERDRLGQVLVEVERPRDRPRDLRDLERMREAGAWMVALGEQEDLGLVFEAPE